MVFALTPVPRGEKVVDDNGVIQLQFQQLIEALVAKVNRIGGLVGQPVDIINGIQPTTTNAELVYTANGGGSSGTLITAITVSNPTGSAVDCSIWVVPKGQTVSDQFLLVDTENVAANESEALPQVVNQLIPPEGSLYIASGTATSLAFRGTGEEL